MSVNLKVLVFFVWLQAVHIDAQVVITSSLGDEPYACRGEPVTYTCTVEIGEGLSWVAPPYVPAITPIIFLTSDSIGDALSEGGISAILTNFSLQSPSSAVFASELKFDNFDNVQNTTITCFNGSVTGSMDYRLSENSEIRPPRSPNMSMDAAGTDLDEQLHLEYTIATIRWTPPEDIGSFRFAGYFARYTNMRTSEVMEIQLNPSTTSTRIAVMFGDIFVELQTRDVCGNMSQPVNMTFNAKRRDSPVAAALIPVSIVSFIFLLLIVALAIFAGLAYKECRKLKDKALQRDMPLTPSAGANRSADTEGGRSGKL